MTCWKSRVFLVLHTYLRVSELVFCLFAACVGCDFTADPSGVHGVGPKSFFAVLRLFLDGGLDIELSAESFARQLVISQRSSGNSDAVIYDYVFGYIASVCDVFRVSARYYDTNMNVCRVDGSQIQTSTQVLVNLAKGEVNPRTMEPFSPDDLAKLDSFAVHNFSHRSFISREDLLGCSLPPGSKSLEMCNVDELRPMWGVAVAIRTRIAVAP